MVGLSVLRLVEVVSVTLRVHLGQYSPVETLQHLEYLLW